MMRLAAWSWFMTMMATFTAIKRQPKNEGHQPSQYLSSGSCMRLVNRMQKKVTIYTIASLKNSILLHLRSSNGLTLPKKMALIVFK